MTAHRTDDRDPPAGTDRPPVDRRLRRALAPSTEAVERAVAAALERRPAPRRHRLPLAAAGLAAAALVALFAVLLVRPAAERPPARPAAPESVAAVPEPGSRAHLLTNRNSVVVVEGPHARVLVGRARPGAGRDGGLIVIRGDST